MSTAPTRTLTVEQAIARAGTILEAAQRLTQAAGTVSASHDSFDRALAESMKERQLLAYRVTTVPDALEPILRTLIAALAVEVPETKERQYALS